MEGCRQQRAGKHLFSQETALYKDNCMEMRCKNIKEEIKSYRFYLLFYTLSRTGIMLSQLNRILSKKYIHTSSELRRLL